MAIPSNQALDRAKSVRLSAEGRTYGDRVSDSGFGKLYRFRLRRSSKLNLTLKGLRANANLELLQDRDRNGQIGPGEAIATSRSLGNSADAISLKGLAAGTYYVRVYIDSGRTRYKLDLAGSRTDRASLAYQVVEKTNALRVRNGLLPLALNTQLSKAAQFHSNDMARQDFVDHTGSNGSSPFGRMNTFGYQYSSASENIGAGYATANQAMQGWIDSPGHLENILDPSVKEIGIGYRYLSSDAGNENWYHYWTQKFGAPL